MELVSIVVPCYNEREALPRLWDDLCAVLPQIPARAEILLVDDGSCDGTLEVMRALREKDPRVRYIAFSRNFGKEAAILAGLRAARGDYVALMDADGQDPPAFLPRMFSAVAREGYDSAALRRVSRSGEPPLRSFFARTFYRIMRRISDADIQDGARDYRLMSRRMTDAVLSLGERGRFTKGIFGWVGFKTLWIPFENVPRSAGVSKWSFYKLLKYSVQGVIAFSDAPLGLITAAGGVFTAASAVWTLVLACLARPGRYYLPPLVVFCTGMLLLALGVAGMYLWRIYREAQARPVYIVARTDADDR